MSSASFSIMRTYAHRGRRIMLGLGQCSAILLWAVSASAQTPGTSTSQTCTQDPTYCSDTGATTSTTTGTGTSGSGGGGVERRFGWWQLRVEQRQFRRRRRRPAGDP
jgi:hypothetical protein